MSSQGLLPWRQRENNPITSLHEAMNSLFDDFSRGLDFPFRSSLTPALAEKTFWPRVEVCEDEKEVVVNAELPGLDEKDVDVQLAGNTLTIKGEKKSEKEEKKRNFYRMERSYGAFERNVELPCEVDRERVQASFKKGVLSITLPKTVEAQKASRKIAVRAG